jgi:hypothetical protein
MMGRGEKVSKKMGEANEKKRWDGKKRYLLISE